MNKPRSIRQQRAIMHGQRRRLIERASLAEGMADDAHTRSAALETALASVRDSGDLQCSVENDNGLPQPGRGNPSDTAAAFDPKSYRFGAPDSPTWNARLDGKTWGSASNLRLYFTEEATGARYWLSVWHRDNYRPRKGGPNFRDEAVAGDRFRLLVTRTKDGNPNLQGATKLND